jgi:PAS domain S-box-containing protein
MPVSNHVSTQPPAPLQELEIPLQPSPISCVGEHPSPSEALDFASWLEISQALASTIQLDELLPKLSQIMLAQSGADLCGLVLAGEDDLHLRIITDRHGSELLALPLAECDRIPKALIEAVQQTEAMVLVNQLQTELPILDGYLHQHQPQTALGLPILKQETLVGILYLETQQGLLDGDRLPLINLLCTQVAISLENALLFAELNQREYKLQQSMAFLAAQRESSLDGILVVNRDRTIDAYNQRFLDIWPVDPELRHTRDDHKMLAHVVGKTADPKAFLAKVLYLYDHPEESSHCELTLLDGRIIERTSVPVNSAEGENWGRIWYFRDITERKQAELELRTSQQRLSLLIQGTPLAVIEWDDGFNVTAWNTAAQRVFGYSAEEAMGQNAALILPEEAKPYVQDILDALLSQQGGTHSINQNIAKGGREITCEWHNATLISPDGATVGVASVVMDITERQAAATAIQQKSEELAQALHQLQQAQLHIVQSEKMSALGNLVAGVAHEINNPIGCVVGNVNAVQDYARDLLGIIDLYAQKFPEPGAEIEDELETVDLDYVRDDLPKLIKAMKDGGDRIKSISRSLRTFSRADADSKQAFNLHEGLDSTVLILRHRLKANDLRPEIQVVTDYGLLPNVQCFPGQLNQVFMNILANAIDALDEASLGYSYEQLQATPNRITISTRVEADQLVIAIADNGPGIPESVRARIFDHLFTTKTAGKGTGLGLAIARQIMVETHGGELNVTSDPGHGTQFVMALPLGST